ncbi:MAG: guanylate kinase [Terriglobia bacterium]
MATTEQGQIFIVSGPSGSGKTTVVEHLLKVFPDLVFSVSSTTRAPRAGEQQGREYCFVSRTEFEAMIARDDLLEYADVFGHLYGTPRRGLAEARRQGKDIVLDIDVQGARQVKSRLPEAVAILVLPPSWQELERRLRARGLDQPETIQRRLEQARTEIENYDTYDYLVVNRRIEDTCVLVEAIVADARYRRCGDGTSSLAEEVRARAATARKEANLSQISAILDTFGAQLQ